MSLLEFRQPNQSEGDRWEQLEKLHPTRGAKESQPSASREIKHLIRGERKRNMRDDTNQEKAALHYAAAHAAHYKTKDLQEALELYTSVMSAHPDTPEAGYSRTQIQNIAKSVVPQQELLDAQRELILAHIKQEAPPFVGPAPSSPLASAELPA
jgi:hypothetical protein